MGEEEFKSFTELGLKYIYRYFILHFSLLLILLLISIAFLVTQQNLLSLSASGFFFIIAIIFLFILIFIWLIIGLRHILNGRMEFGEAHESNVILATLLIIAYLIIYFINLTIAQGFTGGAAFIAAASDGFSSSIFLQFFIVIALSVTSDLLFGFSLICLVKKLTTAKQMKKLKVAYVLLVLGTFTINITALIAYILFYKIFKDVHLNISKGLLRPSLIVPCPNCSHEIPIESHICKFCGAKFEKKANEK